MYPNISDKPTDIRIISVLYINITNEIVFQGGNSILLVYWHF